MSIIKPSEEQLRFFSSQNIPLSQVYDATGLPAKKWKQNMRELDMLVAIGVSPCEKSGHRVRTRAGHCAQCNTHALAFLKRFEEENYIYLAVSKGSGLLKIGVTGDLVDRESALNQSGYGEISDWKITDNRYCDNAGEVEHRAHCLLSEYRVSRSYEKEGYLVDCQEIFNCSQNKAIYAIKKAIKLSSI